MRRLVFATGQHRRPRVRYSPPLPLFIAFWAAVDGAAGLVAVWVWMQVAAS